METLGPLIFALSLVNLRGNRFEQISLVNLSGNRFEQIEFNIFLVNMTEIDLKTLLDCCTRGDKIE